MTYTVVQPVRVLINSMPKSGTHLLTSAIEILGYREHFADDKCIQKIARSLGFGAPIMFAYNPVKRALRNEKLIPCKEYINEKISVAAFTEFYVSTSTFRRWLDSISPRKYIIGHIPWTPVLRQILADLNYHHVFIIRDPRAVVASLMPFILDTGKMPIKLFFKDDFKLISPSQRLNFILEGGYASKAGVTLKRFDEVYRSMLAWRNDPSCLFVRFEDLVGLQGGGSVEKQSNVMKKIASTLGISLNDNIETRFKEVYNPASRTFRVGKINGWKSSMDAKMIERLTEYCQPLCEEAGYEV